jgi:hypothetical protein
MVRKCLAYNYFWILPREFHKKYRNVALDLKCVRQNCYQTSPNHPTRAARGIRLNKTIAFSYPSLGACVGALFTFIITVSWRVTSYSPADRDRCLGGGVLLPVCTLKIKATELPTRLQWSIRLHGVTHQTAADLILPTVRTSTVSCVLSDPERPVVLRCDDVQM